MRVLAVTQHYWPEPFNTADMCEGLASRGHEVTVLTGLPNYPEGEIYSGYGGGSNRRQERNGVRIVRSWLVPRKRGVAARVANYYSFSKAASRLARKLPGDFDVVVAFQTSPVMMADPAIAYARHVGAPLLHYVIDIWPECLLSGGVSKDSAVYRMFARVSRRIYGEADRLAVTSPLFIDYLSDLLGKPVDAVRLPQYAEDIFSSMPDKRPEGYDPAKINLTFAGNVGAAQSVKTIVEAAALLKDDPAFAFHIVGSGSELDACIELAGELDASNIVFHGRHPIDEMPAYYAASDAMLATFSASPILGYTLPRKVQSYLAAGKPVLGTLVGEAARVMDEAGCGLRCDAENAAGLAAICREFAGLPEGARQAFGAAGRAYYEEHFTKQKFLDTLEGELRKLKGTRHTDHARSQG